MKKTDIAEFEGIECVLAVRAYCTDSDWDPLVNV